MYTLSSFLQIWQHAIVHFLITPEYQHLVDHKQNYHTQGLGTPVICKLSPLPLQDIYIYVRLCANADNISSQILCNCFSMVFDFVIILKNLTF